MPLFGAHFSVAGGLANAVATAVRFECDTLQLFTKNGSQWAAKPISDADATAFRRAATAANLQHLTAHDSYLINLAAPGDDLFRKSIDAFVIEWERAEQLGLSYLVTHPGAHVGSGDEAGLKRILEGLNLAAERCRGLKPLVLLETTAGQGTTLGHRFEHLAALIEGVKEPERFGVCLDTCHVFAAGYPIHTADGFAAAFQEFDEAIGLERLKVLHVNDSVKPFGSRVDRHAGLGLGQIGDGAFRRLVNDPRFAHLPMILETPKEGPDGEELDPINLAKLRVEYRLR
jgi:deoxyribonuclease-4